VSGALPRRHYDRRLWVSGLSRLGLQGVLTHANQFYERRVVRCGQVSQNLAVQSDLSGLEALDEPAVSRPAGTAGRVDADLPQAAEIALLGATVAERVLPPMINGVRRVAIEFRTAHPKALGGSEHSGAALSGGRGVGYAHKLEDSGELIIETVDSGRRARQRA